MSIRDDNQARAASTVSPHMGGAVDSSGPAADAPAARGVSAAAGVPRRDARLAGADGAGSAAAPSDSGGGDAPAGLSADLDRFLAELQRDDNLRVVKLLKASPHETTELVQYTGANGAALGTLLRKHFAAASGLGSAYQDLLRAQRVGQRFQHVPQVHAAYRRDDELVVLMEYVRGETLAALVGRCGQGPAGRAGAASGVASGAGAGQDAAAAAQADAADAMTAPSSAPSSRLDLARRLFPRLCDAVTELHESLPTPLIHRDIKPENIIVTPAGVPVLIDFGIARTYKNGASTDTVHFGTADYAPPEQYGFGQTDIRSDVYALGLVLWFSLTGRVPAPSDRELAYTDPAVPEPLRQVIVRAAAFDPAGRYPSARALRRAFERACERVAAAGPNPSAESDKGGVGGKAQGVSNSAARDAGAVPGVGGEGHPDYAAHAPHTLGNVPADAAHGRALLERRPGRAHGPAEAQDAERAQPAGDGGGAFSGSARPAAVSTAPAGAPASGFALRVRTAIASGRDLLARTPRWLGRTWNVLLVFYYVVFMGGCVQAITHPTAQDAGYPVWFLILEYGVYLGVSFTMLFAALYDTRRLRSRFPRLPRRRSLVLTGWAMLYLMVGIVIITIVLNAVVLA